MIHKIVRILSILFFAVLCSKVSFSQVSFSAKVDTTKVLIGDPVALHLSILNIPNDAVFQIQSFVEQLKGLEVIDAGKPDTIKTKEGYNIEQKFSVAAYDSGTFAIPAITIDVIKQQEIISSLSSKPINITVRTLDVDTTKPYMPIKANMEAPIYWYEKWWIWAIIIGVLLLGGLLYFILRKKTTKEVKQPKLKVKLHDYTLNQLKQLEQQKLNETGNVKLYYSELSEIVKFYIDKRFKLQTAEQTTAEVLQVSKRISGLKKQRTELKLILRTADLVKFAKGQPDNNAMQMAMEAAVRLVMQTKEQEQEEVQNG